jgi:hypothetical protein
VCIFEPKVGRAHTHTLSHTHSQGDRTKYNPVRSDQIDHMTDGKAAVVTSHTKTVPIQAPDENAAAAPQTSDASAAQQTAVCVYMCVCVYVCVCVCEVAIAFTYINPVYESICNHTNIHAYPHTHTHTHTHSVPCFRTPPKTLTI